MKFLIDTGANKNFISTKLAFNAIPVTKPFKIQSAAGEIPISLKVTGQFFKSQGNNTFVDFFVLPALKTFDSIIGDGTLRKLNAIIDRKNHFLMSKGAKESKQVNTLQIKSDHLNDALRVKLQSTVDEFSDIFGSISDKEFMETNVRAEIKTSTSEPIYTKSYPYPANLREEVEKQISKMIENGIIRASKSPYNSPIWIVPKKPNSSREKQYRLGVDFKRLNAVTISDTYPIPDITNPLASLGTSKYYITLDLTSGFHQIKMKETDIPKTAFSTTNGKYEFTRLPFGLKNAPAIFQRMIDDVLKLLIGQICYVYIDDIIILGKTEDEHFRNLRTVFTQLRNANLKVNLNTSSFLKTEVDFLGYVISQDGILPNPKKIRL